MVLNVKKRDRNRKYKSVTLGIDLDLIDPLKELPNTSVFASKAIRKELKRKKMI